MELVSRDAMFHAPVYTSPELLMFLYDKVVCKTSTSSINEESPSKMTNVSSIPLVHVSPHITEKS